MANAIRRAYIWMWGYAPSEVQGQSPDHGLRVVWKSWGLPLTSYSSPLSPFSVYHPTPPELRAGGWAKSRGTEPTEPPYFKPCPLKMKAILRSGFNYLIFGAFRYLAHCCLLVIYLCRLCKKHIWAVKQIYWSHVLETGLLMFGGLSVAVGGLAPVVAW